MSKQEFTIPRSNLLLSAQRALLGAISSNILGICVSNNQSNKQLITFVEGVLSSSQKETLDIVCTEIMADFNPPINVTLKVIEHSQSPLETLGIWVFLRYGCRVIE